MKRLAVVAVVLLALSGCNQYTPVENAEITIACEKVGGTLIADPTNGFSNDKWCAFSVEQVELLNKLAED